LLLSTSFTIASASASVGFEIAYPNPGSFLESPSNLDPSGISPLINQGHSRELGSHYAYNIMPIYKNFGTPCGAVKNLKIKNKKYFSLGSISASKNRKKLSPVYPDL